jgi:catechol 2,3-dioxygenase-like lactoylglutathione lyase family enzyme
MKPAITLITLGVSDIAASAAFYELLGWRRSSVSNEGIAFFQLEAVVLSLFGRAALLEDAGFAAAPASAVPAMSLAQNVESPEAVLAVLEQAVAAGARLVKPGQKAFWGGFSGYFADPDGHLWEIAHNPFFALDDRGQVRLPD